MMNEAEKVRTAQESVYVATHSGKVHVDPNCQYLRHRDDYTKKEVQALPDWKLDLCDWCDRYLDRQFENMSVDGCERCGKETENTYCKECYQTIHRRKTYKKVK